MSKQWRSWPLHVVSRGWIQDETKHKRPRPRLRPRLLQIGVKTETKPGHLTSLSMWFSYMPAGWCQSADCWNVDDIWSSHFTTDAFLAIRLLSELHQQFILLLYLTFVNIKSDFDSTDINTLWKALHVRAIPDILLHLFSHISERTLPTLCVSLGYWYHNICRIQANCPTSLLGLGVIVGGPIQTAHCSH